MSYVDDKMHTSITRSIRYTLPRVSIISHCVLETFLNIQRLHRGVINQQIYAISSSFEFLIQAKEERKREL